MSTYHTNSKFISKNTYLLHQLILCVFTPIPGQGGYRRWTVEACMLLRQLILKWVLFFLMGWSLSLGGGVGANQISGIKS